MDDGFTTLTVATYADRAAKTDRGVDGRSLAFPILGLFGETGSLLSVPLGFIVMTLGFKQIMES